MANNTSTAPPDRTRVLLVGQFAPPASVSAARRIGGLAKYLERRGFEVTVLTSVALGEGPVPHASRTCRTRDLLMSPLNWRRGHLGALVEGSAESYDAKPSRLGHVVVPDLALATWLPFATSKALALHREHRYACVVTSSPPESAHLVGFALQRLGAAWIADLRDGWSFETTHPHWPLKAQHHLDRRLEHIIARNADHITAVTDPIAADLRERYGVVADTVPNGFDPEEQVTGQLRDPLRAGAHTLVHTGRMAYAGRDPGPLLHGLRLLADRRPDLGKAMDTVFAGPISERERDLIDGTGGLARWAGTLPRDETLRLQNAADTLILLTGRDRRSEATAKLYEYLATGRQILVLGDRSAAAQIVADADCGEVVPAADPEAIAAAVEKLIDIRPSDRVGRGAAVERYSYDHIAGQMEDHITRLSQRL